MMTGLPGSDDESDVETARRIAALEPDGVRVYPTVIVRDTALCDLWRAGKYTEHTVEDARARLRAHFARIRGGGHTRHPPGPEPDGGPLRRRRRGRGLSPGAGRARARPHSARRGEALLEGTPEGADAVLEVPARLLSQYVGQHGCNRDYLVRKFGLHSLKFIPSAQSKGVKRDA